MPRVAALTLALVAIAWGCTYVLVKGILSELSPTWYVALRFSLSVPLIVILYRAHLFAWWQAQRVRASRDIVRTELSLLLPGLFLALAFATQVFGLLHTGPGTAAVITSLVVIVVPLIELVLGQRGRIAGFAAPMALALIGALLMMPPTWKSLSLSTGPLVLCAVGYAGQLVLSSTFNAGAHYAVQLAHQGGLVWALALVALVIQHAPVPTAIANPRILFALLFVSVVATVGCYSIQLWAQHYVRPRYVGLIYTLEPVVAMAIAIGFGYEQASPIAIVGATLVVLAVVLTIVTLAPP